MDRQIIIHIAGPQGSGKTTMGQKLMDKFGYSIYVKDLDDLWAEYSQSQLNAVDYQTYINEYIISHNNKPLIFVGLDADLCLGPIGGLIGDAYYEFQTKHLYYINNPIERTLQQRFYRQVEKLYDRKEEMFENYLKNPNETQKKLFRFVSIDEWKKNTQECNQLYSNRQYQLLDFDQIYNIVSKLINPNQIAGRSKRDNTFGRLSLEEPQCQVNRCSYKLKNGERCRKNSKNWVYCWQHQ